MYELITNCYYKNKKEFEKKNTTVLYSFALRVIMTSA